MNLDDRPPLDFALALLQLRGAGYDNHRVSALLKVPVGTVQGWISSYRHPLYENGRAIKRLYRSVFDRDLPEKQTLKEAK